MLQSRLFTTAAGSVLWAPEIPGLVMRLQGHVSLDQYQLLLNHGLQMYTGHRHPEAVAHWIVDLRQLSTLHAGAHHWMATTGTRGRTPLGCATCALWRPMPARRRYRGSCWLPCCN